MVGFCQPLTQSLMMKLMRMKKIGSKLNPLLVRVYEHYNHLFDFFKMFVPRIKMLCMFHVFSDARDSIKMSGSAGLVKLLSNASIVL